MTEQQTNDFALWFEQFMDPELNLTPGDKELCQHAWQAALSHAERREFKTEQDLISFLDGLYETAGPDSSALTGQKWVAAQRAIEGIRSHAEGEAPRAASFEQMMEDCGARYLGGGCWEWDCDTVEFIRRVQRYAHPAPQVAVPEVSETAPRRAALFLDGLGSGGKEVQTLRKLLAAAAPAAPAGQDHAAELCAAAEMMAGWFESAAEDAGWTRENANAAWAAHTVSRAAIRRYQDGEAVPTAPAGEQPVSDPDGLPGFECPECGGESLEWQYIHNGPADVADGRLRLNEVSTVFFLGCADCSESARTVGADEVCRILSAPAPAPDEREIAGAIKALEVVGMRISSEVVNFQGATANETGARAAHRVVLNEIARLRAGKEGE